MCIRDRSQSPITANQFFEWDKKLQTDEILVREIIDIDTNYMEDENTGQSAKQKKSSDDVNSKSENGEQNNEEADSDDEFNPTLAAMETEIKPKVLKTINDLTNEYDKLLKYQKEKLDCVLKSVVFSPVKEKTYQKIVTNILENIKTLQLSPSVLEAVSYTHLTLPTKRIV